MKKVINNIEITFSESLAQRVAEGEKAQTYLVPDTSTLTLAQFVQLHGGEENVKNILASNVRRISVITNKEFTNKDGVRDNAKCVEVIANRLTSTAVARLGGYKKQIDELSKLYLEKCEVIDKLIDAGTDVAVIKDHPAIAERKKLKAEIEKLRQLHAEELAKKAAQEKDEDNEKDEADSNGNTPAAAPVSAAPANTPPPAKAKAPANTPQAKK